MGSPLNSIVESFKKGYYFLEDRYYMLLDKVNGHVPIYKIVDPVDRVFPSFVLLIAVLACLAILLTFMLLPQVSLSATLRVLDENNDPLEGAHISVSFNGESIGLDTDDFGEAKLALPQSGVEATILVSKDGFDRLSQTITLKTNDLVDLLLSRTKASFQATKFTIYVVDSKTDELIKGQVRIEFTCSTGTHFPAPLSGATGEFKGMEVSGECGTLLAKAMAEGYAPKANVAITRNPTYLKLDPVETTTTINVIVMDYAGNAVQGAIVKAFGGGNALVQQLSTDTSGTASIQGIEPGVYSVTASHSDGRYAEKTGVEALLGAPATVTLSFTQPATGNGEKIFMRFTDALTNANIPNATVLIYANNLLLDSKTSDSSGLIEKAVDGNKSFIAVASHDNYITQIISNVAVMDALSKNPQAIKLTPLSSGGSNSGKASVFVSDYETKKPVEGAQAFLYSADYPEIILNYPYALTNADGNVLISRLPEGSYFVKAKKSNTEGTSETGRLVAGATLGFSIMLITTEGKVKAEVVDKKTGSPIQGAEITFTDYATDSVLQSGVSDAQGKLESQPFKSNKTVYLKAGAAGYFSAISLPLPIVPKSAQSVRLELDSKSDISLDQNMAIKFGGFYADKSLKHKATTLESGETGQLYYYIKFTVLTTKDANYSNIMHHIRLNSEEKGKSPEKLPTPAGYTARLLNYAASSPYSSTILSACYNPENVFSSPEACITDLVAKQANTLWATASRQTAYTLVLEMEIEQNLVDGTEIELRYQGKAIMNNSKFMTQPFLQTFRIGEPICSPPDCPAAIMRFWLQDSNGNKAILQSFSGESDYTPGQETKLASYSDYRLFYEIRNTSGVELAATLKLENADPPNVVSIQGENAHTAFSGLQIAAHTATSQGSPVQLKTSPEAAFTKIKASFTSTQGKAMEQFIPFTVTAAKELTLSVSPSMLIPNDGSQILSGYAKSSDGTPVQGASISIFLPGNVLFESLVSGGTGAFSSTRNFRLQPNEKVSLVATAPGYKKATVEVPVNFGDYFDPRYNCIEVPPLGEDVRTFKDTRPGGKGMFEVVNNCETPVEIMFNSKLEVEPKQMQIPAGASAQATFTADNPEGGEQVYLGQYPIYVKAKMQGDVRFVNAVKVLVIISDPVGSCFAIDKTSFNLLDGNMGSGEITNDCAVQFNDAWAPELALDSFKAIIQRDDVQIPGMFPFEWGVRAELSLSTPVRVEFEEKRENTWSEFYIPTGPDTGPDYTINKSITVNVGESMEGITALKFDSIIIPSPIDLLGGTDYGSIAYLASSNIYVDGIPVPVPECVLRGCTWEESGKTNDAAKCHYSAASCYYHSFEVQLQRGSIGSITFPIYNSENRAFLFFSLNGTLIETSYGFDVNHNQFELEFGPQPTNLFRSTIVPVRGLGFALGKIDPSLASKLGEGLYSVEDANITVYTNNPEVEVWLVDNVVYGKYVGKDAADDGQGATPFTIKGLYLDTTQYNLIYVDDYVNELRPAK